MRQHQEPNFVLGERELAVADQMQHCRAESPDAGMSVPPLETMLAEFYVKAKVRLDQVPRLLDAGLKAIEKQEKYRISRELIPAEMMQRGTMDNATLTQERTQQIRAGYLIASGRATEARGVVQQPQRRRLQYRRNECVRLLAEVTEKEGRPQDALELYRSTLEGTPREVLGRSDNPHLASIKKLYLSHGGTEEKWLEWAASAKAAETIARPPLVFSQILPDFSAKDLSGRTWQLIDLKGNATFINYWATWCGPCRAEHPEIQKLHDRLKGRKDAQVLTISVDDTAALAAAYVKEKSYTFAVIHAPALADRLLPYAGLPTNFLVNAKGERTSFYGFGGRRRRFAESARRFSRGYTAARVKYGITDSLADLRAHPRW